jgi:hypothetical protein
MIFEVLTAVKMPMVGFWVVTPCELAYKQQGLSVLKIEVLFSSETLVPISKPTRRHNPADHRRCNIHNTMLPLRKR